MGHAPLLRRFRRAGKGAHALDREGEVLLSCRVEATEEDIEAACSEIAGLEASGERVVGIDLTGGPAALLEAVAATVEGAKIIELPGLE